MGNAIDKLLGVDIKKISIKCWCCTKGADTSSSSVENNMEIEEKQNHARSSRRSISELLGKHESRDELLRKLAIILILHQQGLVAEQFDDGFCRDVYGILLNGGDVTFNQRKAVLNIYRKFHIKQKKKRMNYQELYRFYQTHND